MCCDGRTRVDRGRDNRLEGGRDNRLEGGATTAWKAALQPPDTPFPEPRQSSLGRRYARPASFPRFTQ
jgi:hypothetical protein